MPQSIKELTERRGELVVKARAILDGAAKESRELNSEERASYAKVEADLEAACDALTTHVADSEREAKLAKLEQEMSEPVRRQTSPITPPRAGGDGASLSFDFGRAGTVNLRPGDMLYERAKSSYNDAFNSYLRGDKRDFETLGLKVSDDSKGGYLVPMEFLAMLIKFLDNLVFMRRLGTVLPPTMAKSVGVLSYDTDPTDADWTPEITATDISEDDSIRYGGREMMPHGLSKLIKASMKLVRAHPALAAFLASRLAYIFAVTEEKAFMTGPGNQRPLGVFTASTFGITTSQDITASATTSFTADNVIDTLYDLKDPYVANSSWIVSREFRKRCRKLKDGNGNYLLVEGERNNSGTLTSLLERPMAVSEYCPQTYTTGLYIAAVGDMSHYWIQDGMGLELQYLGELFALRGQVGWIGRKETDAMPVLAEAFRRLKLA